MNKKEMLGVAIWLIFAIVLTTICVYGLMNSNEEPCENEVIYHTYFVNDTTYKTTYYPSNNSYTIDKLFTCDGKVFYSSFESYLEKCVNDMTGEQNDN